MPKRSHDPNENLPLSLFEKICVAACCFIAFVILLAIACCVSGCRTVTIEKENAPKSSLSSTDESYPLPHRWWTTSSKNEN